MKEILSLGIVVSLSFIIYNLCSSCGVKSFLIYNPCSYCW